MKEKPSWIEKQTRKSCIKSKTLGYAFVARSELRRSWVANSEDDTEMRLRIGSSLCPQLLYIY